MIISFANQKGGAGKTTTTILTATAINHYYDKTVCVVDLDIQRSLIITREEEMDYIKELDSLNKLNGNNKEFKALKNLKSLNKKLYPIYAFDVKKEDTIDKILELEKQYDIVMVDIPGSIDVQGLSKAITFIDYIFVPIFAERKNYNSTFDFIGTLEKLKRNSNIRLKNYFVYFFNYNARERQGIWNFLKELFDDKKIYLFDNKIHEGNADDLNTSTIVPLRDNFGKSIYSFTEEVLKQLYPTEELRK
ncbi:ParA family protein [Elizabethkingia ursingii]